MITQRDRTTDAARGPVAPARVQIRTQRDRRCGICRVDVNRSARAACGSRPVTTAGIQGTTNDHIGTGQRDRSARTTGTRRIGVVFTRRIDSASDVQRSLRCQRHASAGVAVVRRSIRIRRTDLTIEAEVTRTRIRRRHGPRRNRRGSRHIIRQRDRQGTQARCTDDVRHLDVTCRAGIQRQRLRSRVQGVDSRQDNVRAFGIHAVAGRVE